MPLGQFRLRAAGLQMLVPAKHAAAKGGVGTEGRQALSQEPRLGGERREAQSKFVRWWRLVDCVNAFGVVERTCRLRVEV